MDAETSGCELSTLRPGDHLQAWEDGKGSGVVTYNGRMIENLHVESAQRTLSMHDAIQALESEQG